MTGIDKALIRDNLAAFTNNFGAPRIVDVDEYSGRGFFVYLPADSETHIEYCPNIHHLNGWLWGAVQAVHRKEFRSK